MAIALIATVASTALAIGASTFSAIGKNKATNAAADIDAANATRTHSFEQASIENQRLADQHDSEVAAHNAEVGAENAARASEARAENDEFNARLAERQAANVIAAGKAESQDFKDSQTARAASRTASRAASGIALTGSALMITEDIIDDIELGMERIGLNQLAQVEDLDQEAKFLRVSASREIENAARAREAGATSVGFAQFSGELANQAAEIRRQASDQGLQYSLQSSQLQKKTAKTNLVTGIVGGVASGVGQLAGSKSFSAAFGSGTLSSSAPVRQPLRLSSYG